MSLGTLVDFESDSNGPEIPSSSQDDESTWESTYPRIDGEWAIGDEINEPVAIVGIGTLTTAFFM